MDCVIIYCIFPSFMELKPYFLIQIFVREKIKENKAVI